MVSVVLDGERVLQQDDGRIIMASEDLSSRINQVSSQEQQMAQITSLSPDPAIPITFTKVYISEKNLFLCCELI